MSAIQVKIYPIDVSHEKLYTLEQLGDLIGLKHGTMKKRKADGKVPESIFVSGVELYPVSFVNEYILKSNPKLLERVANASQIKIKANRAFSTSSEGKNKK